MSCIMFPPLHDNQLAVCVNTVLERACLPQDLSFIEYFFFFKDVAD